MPLDRQGERVWAGVRHALIVDLIAVGEYLGAAYYNNRHKDVDRHLGEIGHLYMLIGLAGQWFLCKSCEGTGLLTDGVSDCPVCFARGSINGLAGMEHDPNVAIALKVITEERGA